MDRCAGGAGTFRARIAVRFAPTEYQAPPAIAKRTAIARANGTSNERHLPDAALLIAFACAGLPTSTE
jgi:hypothetical protein